MQGPRTPLSSELHRVVEFLDHNLRQNNSWTIASEYPTALSTSNMHNMSIITDDDKIVSHAVLKPFIVKSPHAIFKVGAIGSVVTDPAYRQQGHSTNNVKKCIDLAVKQDCDLVILWTDQFDFYRKLGFELAGFDYSYVVESSQPIKHKNLRFVTGNNVDPAALLRLYSQHSVHAIRTLEDFKQFLKIPNSNLFTAWDPNNQLVAYAVEGKGIDLINYIHEWAGQSEALIDLFHYIRSQKNQAITIMSPSHSQNLRKKLNEVSQLGHQGFLGMLKIVNHDALFAKIKKAFTAEGFDKFVLERQGDKFVFGFGSDLYTFEKESDVIQLIFGPLDIGNIGYLSADTKLKLSKLLPMPLWIWGWDSI